MSGVNCPGVKCPESIVLESIVRSQLSLINLANRRNSVERLMTGHFSSKVIAYSMLENYHDFFPEFFISQ